MKTRWLWVILIAAVVALGWASARTTEPQYEGRSLTSWLIAYSEADAEAQREVAARVISHVGTNAIPCLLDKIRYQPGPLKSLLIDAVYRLPEPLCYRGVRLLDHECKLESAAVGFRILGPSARAAVPDLIQLVDPRNNHDPASYALQCIGPTCIPDLVAAAKNNQNPLNVRRGVVWVMAGFATNSDRAIPELMGCLRDEPIEMGPTVTWVIPQIAADVPKAMNLLDGALKQVAPDLRVEMAQSTENLGWRGCVAIPFLEALLTDQAGDVRLAASNALHIIRMECSGK